jgi:EAL domain-containing protein (putative c-di-GMP-specific phosphodiesterase class I)/DNA-binding response OmpR family regulator
MPDHLSMNNKTFNILILDPGFYNKSIIQELLVTNEFNVHVATSEAEASAALESFRPDIVLCKASSGMILEDRLLCGFKSKADEKGIPFVAVSSVADVDFFLQSLKHGICHSIMLPSSTEYLASRITDILKHDHVKILGGSPVAIDFSYRGKEYSISLNPSKLVQFIISLLHDSVNLSLTLTDAVQKKGQLEHRIRRPDIYGHNQKESEPNIEIEKELNQALDRKEFQLYYQPIIALDDERMTGFEALIRWNHPERGLVPPFEFITLAEQLPVMIPLGFWIIEEAVKQYQIWEKKFSFDRPIQVSINMSASQFIHPELSGKVSAIIKQYGVNPENIAFEITESAFMTDMEAANLQLLQLKSNRHSFCMDDFGTGYSSLTYLQHFIVDTVKIDRSFVRWMHMDEQSEQIVRSVVGLAHNLKMTVVAEGVEEDRHMSMLKELKCDYGQGFYYSAPMPASDAEEYIVNFYHKKRR